MRKYKKGITLVGLVITIVVLLILAGITINLTIGEDGIIKRAQQAGKNYIDAAENEKVQLGQFMNEMDNIISASSNNGKTPYNSEFRKNVVAAINDAGVDTSEEDTDDKIITNIGKILQEGTKDATALEEDIAEGKTAYVNGKMITGNSSIQATKFTGNSTYNSSGVNTIKIDITSVNGYENKTLDNMYAGITSFSGTLSNTGAVLSGSISIDEYDSNTGIVTITIKYPAGGAYGAKSLSTSYFLIVM